MGESKHTKGPWRIQMLGAQEADLISGGTFMGLTGGSGAPDAYDPDDAAEWEANARLISAAPDLVEALKAATERCEKFLDTFGDVGDCVTRADIGDWHAALSKAGV